MVCGWQIRLVCKHFLQAMHDVAHGVRSQATEAFYQALDIDRPKLIQRHKARLLLKPARNPPRVRLFARGHRCHYRRAEVLIELVWGHDDTRASLPDLTAKSWIQPHQMHVAARGPGSSYHCHS